MLVALDAVVVLAIVGQLALAVGSPAEASSPVTEQSRSRADVGPPLPARATEPAPVAAPAAPGLQVVAGTVAPETGVSFDASGRARYSGTAPASMTTERKGNQVVITILQRP